MKKLIAVVLLGSFILVVASSFDYSSFRTDNTHVVIKQMDPAVMDFSVPAVVRPLTEVLVIPNQDVAISPIVNLIDAKANSPPQMI